MIAKPGYVIVTAYEVWCCVTELGAKWDMVYRCWTSGAAYGYMAQCVRKDRDECVRGMFYEIREVETEIAQ